MVRAERYNRRMRAAGVLLAWGVACGGADHPEPPEQACPEWVNARFRLRWDESSVLVSGSYEDWGRGSAEEAGDGCTTFTVDNDGDVPGPCGGGCSSDEICYQEECVAAPRAMDVGAVTVTAPDSVVTLSRSPDDRYGGIVVAAPGELITVEGGGPGTEVDRFAMSVRVVPPLTLPADHISSTEDGDLVVTWDPADSPPGTRVSYRASTDGISERHVECWSDDTGQLTVPAGDVVSSPDHATITRRAIGTAETEHGCGMVESFSSVDADIESARRLVSR